MKVGNQLDVSLLHDRDCLSVIGDLVEEGDEVLAISGFGRGSNGGWFDRIGLQGVDRDTKFVKREMRDRVGGLEGDMWSKVMRVEYHVGEEDHANGRVGGTM